MASVFGAALGLIYACLTLVVDLWLLTDDNRLSAPRVYVQRLTCGAIAGGLISFPILSDLSGLCGLGVTSALVSNYAHLRKARPAKVESRGKDEKQAG